MGYDMTIINRQNVKPEAEHEAAAKQVLDAIRNLFELQRDQKVFKDAKDMSRYLDITHDLESYCERILDPGYFRLNNFGMMRYAEAMEETGMMQHLGNPMPDWESLPDPEVVGEDAYLEALDQLTGHASPLPEQGIASYKFSSNDGWWVTPEECAGAIKSWAEFEESDTLITDLSGPVQNILESDYWKSWLGFLELASKHGGFRVF